MSQIIDLDKRFDDWFNEQEGFGLRSERFFDSLNQFKSEEGLQANLILWLKASYLHGIRVAAQDSCDTLRDYATALAGCEAETLTPTQKYDEASDNLMVYWTQVLVKKEDQ